MPNEDPDKLYWNDFIERYRDARTRGEKSIWERADIASEVDTTYGGGELMKFSYQVKESLSTLMAYRWVSRAYAVEERCENLSFRHHQVLASMEDRLDWLKKAEENHWSVSVLISEMRPDRQTDQERAIEKLSIPKHPAEYTLSELMLLDLEERHRIMAEANFATEDLWGDDNSVLLESAVSPLEAVEVLNYQIQNNKDELSSMNILDVVKLLFGRVMNIDFEDDKFVLKGLNESN